MFAALFGTAFLHTNIIVIIILSIIMVTLIIGVTTNHRNLVKYSKTLIHFALGFFGVFRCQDKKEFCYLGISLKGSKLVIAVLIELGIIVFAGHVGLTLLLMKIGVANLHTLYTPIIGYFIYPALLACFRKKCS